MCRSAPSDQIHNIALLCSLLMCNERVEVKRLLSSEAENKTQFRFDYNLPTSIYSQE